MTKQPIRIYKYLTAEYALRSIKTGELKVSTIDTLNDPFELSPHFTVSDPEDPEKCQLAEDSKECWREAVRAYGIICMSNVICDPALWSHYADSHRGIAIEFVAPGDDILSEVSYTKHRMSFPADRLLANRADYRHFFQLLIRHKADSWQYEREFRMFVKLNDCVVRNGLYFYPVSDDVIRRVILGVKCDVEESYVRRLLAQKKWRSVEIVRAKLSESEFEVEV